MNFIPPEDEGRLRAAASGVLPNGKAVVVNTDGTVSVVSGASTTAVTFNNANSLDTSSVFDSNSNKVVVAYKDVGDSQHGYAIVGTVSGSSISFGTEVKFESAVVSGIGIGFDSNLNKVLIVYKDEGNSFYGTSIVGTVSGTSISFGTPVVYSSATTSSQTATFDSNSNKIVVAYTAGAKVGTISGTGISYGSAATFTSSAASRIAMCFDSNSNKLVVSFRPQSDDQGYTAVGTVSGTSISFGTAVKFNAATTSSINNTFDSNSNKVVVAYDNDGNSSYGTAIVGTVSGTSISFGSPVVFKTAESNVTQNGAFNTETNTVVLSFSGAGGALAFIEGTVSGTSISFGPEFLDSSVGAGNPVTVFDSNAKKTVASTAANPGKSVVYTPGSAPLTAENYIGITNGALVSEVNSKVAFESAQITNASSTIDTNVNRIVIAYLDEGNSSYGTAIVGTISGSTVSFGTAVVFSSSATKYTSTVFDSNSNKIIIGFEDSGASGHGKCIVGTINAGNNSISFGTVATFEAAAVSYVSLAFDSNSNKAVVAFVDEGDSNKGKARVATVSGTNISFGSIQTFANAATTGIFSAFDSNSNKVVISYGDTANSGYGTSIVGTVSATNISFGSEVAFASHEISFLTSTFDSSNNKIVLAYKNEANNQGTAIVGTVSGTGISFGTAVVFSTLSTASVGSTFDTAAGKVLLTFDTGGAVTRIISGTVSGTGISFSASTIFTGLTLSQSFTIPNYNSVTNNVLIVLTDSGNSAYGTAVVFSEEIRGQVASGSSASVDIIGTVSTNQDGLTPGQSYFVQTDGTLALTAGTPSVFAGTAISATKLLVKT